MRMSISDCRFFCFANSFVAVESRLLSSAHFMSAIRRIALCLTLGTKIQPSEQSKPAKIAGSDFFESKVWYNFFAFHAGIRG
jgi:hypothetical protein